MAPDRQPREQHPKRQPKTRLPAGQEMQSGLHAEMTVFLGPRSTPRSLRDARSDVFERLYLDQVARVRAQVALLEQELAETL